MSDASATARIELPDALARIREASARIAPHARSTPTVYSYTFSESAGTDVHLKLESLQRTGSFKLRGALNRLLTLEPGLRRRGLVAASAGNHAQGVALAARLCEVPATIVMPESTSILKVQRSEGYGAEVVLHEGAWDESQRRAEEIAAETGRTLIHPFDDPEVIFGQGTIGLEILAELPEVETIAVPVGGGGLLAGVAMAVKALAPQVRVVGVQASGAASMARSFRTGELVSVQPTTIAEGIRVGTAGRLTLALARRFADDVVEVDDESITEAVVQTMEKSKVVAEAAAVAPVAALIAGKIPSPGRICTVVSGGNIDLNLLARLIESGLARTGRYHLIKLRTPDKPGQLSGVVDVLARGRTNILDIQHHRAGWKVPVGFVDVEVLIETRHEGQGAEVEEALRALGLDVRS